MTTESAKLDFSRPSFAPEAGSPWHLTILAPLAIGVVAAAIVRLVLLPTDGLRGDLDQFVLWVHGIATQPLGRAYDQRIGFPPVMVYVWGLLAAIQPSFQTVSDAADPGIRALMKAPAALADFGLAVGVAYALRARPPWAVIGALGILLHPAVIDVSAWWGQYESIYVLAGLVAYLFAVADRPALAAVALAVSLMTKPQAAPFIVPFAAWFLARYGWRSVLRLSVVGAATIVVLWAPFLAAAGPVAFIRNLGDYQGGVFSVLSLRAWNPWWIVQEAYGKQEFISDAAIIAGPVTLRVVGYTLAAIAEAVIFLAIYRRPTAYTLAIGLAAASLVAFVFLTAMHERYAYPALVFLAVALPYRRVLVLWLGLGVVTTVNLLAAIPPTPQIGDALPIFGPLGVVASVTTCLIALAAVRLGQHQNGFMEHSLLAKEPSGLGS
jgi:hypothetical protein